MRDLYFDTILNYKLIRDKEFREDIWKFIKAAYVRGQEHQGPMTTFWLTQTFHEAAEEADSIIRHHTNKYRQ
jgi:hypothetical protein